MSPHNRSVCVCDCVCDDVCVKKNEPSVLDETNIFQKKLHLQIKTRATIFEITFLFTTSPTLCNN